MSEQKHTADQGWINWHDQRPLDGEAVYWWRVSSRLIDGVEWRPEWTQALRLCGMGYGDREWWPSFSSWDGYHRSVPEGTQWRLADPDIAERTVRHYIHLEPCPICGATPELEHCHSSNRGGVFVGSAPYEANTFWVNCNGCRFVRSPHYGSLKKLQDKWNTRSNNHEPLVEALEAIVKYEIEERQCGVAMGCQDLDDALSHVVLIAANALTRAKGESHG